MLFKILCVKAWLDESAEFSIIQDIKNYKFVSYSLLTMHMN